ncbi:MAG: GNAT family protein [Oligoflexia bacterium]|nr:GNAT family protein [Oligoflexia bacterium]
MQIETKRLILRDQVFEDWRDIHEYAKDSEFSKYEHWGPNTEEDTKNFVLSNIERAKGTRRYKFDFSVVDKKTSKVIGGVGLRRESETSSVGSIGYAIHPLYQNLGFATEAVNALYEFGFNALKLQVLWATADVLNNASYKVMEKSGMKRVGLILRHKEFKMAWHDSYRYEITSVDYFKLAGVI